MIRNLRTIPVLLFALVVAACSPAGSSPSPTLAAPGATGTSAALTPLTVGLGYIPSVQFAPFYLAQRAGYYRAAGLDVTFQNKIETDLVLLVGQGTIDIGVADGTDVIPAVSQDIPVKYVATLYGTYPSILFSKSPGIKHASDLGDRIIGIPGRYGSSWIMLQALLGSAGMTTDNVTIREYPDFGQGVAVQQGVVDAATGFANNEPVQLQLAGIPTTILHVDDVVRLPGPGLIAGKATIEAKRTAIAAFVAATIRAMNEIKANPATGLAAAIAVVPDLATNRATQAAILDATIAIWSASPTSTVPFGTIDRAGWQASIDFMSGLKLLAKPVTVDDLVDATLLPVAGS